MKRKRGLGFTGLADTFAMLRIEYGSKESIVLTKTIQAYITYATLLANIELAKHCGPCELINSAEKVQEYFNTPYMEERVLPNLSLYLGKDELVDIKNITKRVKGGFIEGLRYTHGTAIAPTATISLVSNNMSSGIEPIFSIYGKRNLITKDSKIKKQVSYFNLSYLDYVYSLNRPYKKQDKLTKEELFTIAEKHYEENKDSKALKKLFPLATDLSIKAHIDILKAASIMLDQSCSKTVNLPSDISYEDYKQVYLDGYKAGLKGLTTYRPNPAKITAVLVDENVQKATKYKFTLADGSVHILTGDTMVQPVDEDEYFTASNVYDNFIEPNRHQVNKKK